MIGLHCNKYTNPSTFEELEFRISMMDMFMFIGIFFSNVTGMEQPTGEGRQPGNCGGIQDLAPQFY